MALGLQFFLLGLRAAGVFGVQLPVGFQCRPPGGLVLPALVTGPGGDGDENARRDGLGKVRPLCSANQARMSPTVVSFPQGTRRIAAS